MNKISGKAQRNLIAPFTLAFTSFFLMLLPIGMAPSIAWGETLRITAAADLMAVLPQISRKFTEKTRVNVRISYSSSGESAIAIRHHAPFDLFLSADSSFPEKLSEQGWVVKDSVRSYAKGILVLWFSKKALGSGTDPELKTSLLLGRSVRKIALPNPRLAPYGHAAMECLKSGRLRGTLRKKLVYANSLAQVAQYLKTKTAEAGFLSNAQATVLSRHLKGATLMLSPGCVPDLDQKMAIVKSTPHLKAAMAFEHFILDKSTQDFLKASGYR
jgi:molybdate transport system substrate-binding protein